MAQIDKEEDGNLHDEEDQSLLAALAKRIEKFLVKLEINNAIASVLLASLFILNTYDYDSRSSEVIYICELIIVVDLCLDWLIFLIMAENRLGYLFAPQSLISYITIASSLFCMFSMNIEAIDKYELKFLKTLRILALGRLEDVFKRRNLPLGRAIFSLAFESIAIIFIFAAGMLLLENRFYFQP